MKKEIKQFIGWFAYLIFLMILGTGIMFYAYTKIILPIAN